MTVREGYDFATMAVGSVGAKQRRLSGGRNNHGENGFYISAMDMNFQKGDVYNAEIIKAPAGRMGVLPAPEN